MRGTGFVKFDVVSVNGIIPAYAGNSNFLQPVKFSTRDHPRVCGEQFSSFLPLKIGLGSSPRMRGTVETQDIYITWVGIIPAYAGNSNHDITSKKV